VRDRLQNVVVPQNGYTSSRIAGIQRQKNHARILPQYGATFRQALRPKTAKAAAETGVSVGLGLTLSQTWSFCRQRIAAQQPESNSTAKFASNLP